jgi:hypothetical protein
MKVSLILAPLVLLGDVVSAQSSLTDICTGSANNGCKTTITVPNGFKIVTTKKKVETVCFIWRESKKWILTSYQQPNKCKTKKQVNYNCGTQTKPKTCKKSVCVAGKNELYNSYIILTV